MVWPYVMAGFAAFPVLYWGVGLVLGRRVRARAIAGLGLRPDQQDAMLQMVGALHRMNPRLGQPGVYRALALYASTLPTLDTGYIRAVTEIAESEAATFLRDVERWAAETERFDRTGEFSQEVAMSRRLARPYEWE